MSVKPAPRMRTIGVLGGIGPQATMDFEARLHRAAQRLVPQRFNTGYPPLVTVYLRHAPILVEPDGTAVEPLTLDPRVLDTARRLGEWVDLLAVTSNTPHLFLDDIRAVAGCETLSLVDETIAALREREAETVGLLGLGVPQVYAERFALEGIPYTTPDAEARRALDAAILRTMEGADADVDRAAAHHALEQLRAVGASTIVLGCTELPLLLGDAADAPDCVNPGELLAEAAVRRALD